LLSEPRALIFVNGIIENIELLFSCFLPQDFMVAADGGLRNMQSLGLLPNLLVGDLDSVDTDQLNDLIHKGVEIVRYPPEKDESDLELALKICLERGYKEIFIVAGLGGRIDHILGNIFLLTSPLAEQCDLRIIDGINELSLVRGCLEITGKAGDIVSLIPLNSEVRSVKTTGMVYPLNHESLYRWRTRGVSNVLSGNSAKIEIEEGDLLLCIHIKK